MKDALQGARQATQPPHRRTRRIRPGPLHPVRRPRRRDVPQPRRRRSPSSCRTAPDPAPAHRASGQGSGPPPRQARSPSPSASLGPHQNPHRVSRWSPASSRAQRPSPAVADAGAGRAMGLDPANPRRHLEGSRGTPSRSRTGNVSQLTADVDLPGLARTSRRFSDGAILVPARSRHCRGRPSSATWRRRRTSTSPVASHDARRRIPGRHRPLAGSVETRHIHPLHLGETIAALPSARPHLSPSSPRRRPAPRPPVRSPKTPGSPPGGTPRRRGRPTRSRTTTPTC